MNCRWLLFVVLAAACSVAMAQDSDAKCNVLYRQAGAVPGASDCRLNASVANVGMATYYCTGTPSIIEAYCKKKPNLDCRNNKALRNYEDVRNRDIPKLDNLSKDVRDFLGMFYSVMHDALENLISEKTHNPVPIEVINSTPYLVKMVHGRQHGDERETYEAAIDLYTNTVFSTWPSLQKKMRNLALSMEALDGRGPRTFAEQQDHLDRAAVSRSLKVGGCPSDLTSDYQLPPYHSPGTSG